MADHAIAGVTPEVVAILFDGVEPGEDVLWRGQLYRLDDGRELLPFVFLELRFIASGQQPNR